MDAKQFAWMYMFEYGKANVLPSFYGGLEVVDNTVKGISKTNSWFERYAYESVFLAAIKQYGIDWSKTQAPESDSFSQFTDTFNDPEYKEFLTGKVVLNNGATQSWMAEPPVNNVFEMMAQLDVFKKKFQELDGDA